MTTPWPVTPGGPNTGGGDLEDKVAGLAGWMSNPLSTILKAAGGLINNAIEGVTTWFMHLFDGLEGRVDGFQDGQLELQERTDLLEGVRGFAQAYMDRNSAIGLGSNGWKQMPFRAQLGPQQGAHVDTLRNRIFFLEEGLWTVYAAVRARSTGFTGSNQVALYLRIYRPGGTTFSEFQDNQYPNPGDNETLSISLPFVIPDAGCYVEAWVYSGRWRYIDGGMRYSRLAVVKHDNRTNDPGQDTVPDEEMAT